MNVKRLKELIKDLPDDQEVYIRKYIIKQVRERPGVIFVDELNFIEKDLEKLEKLEKIKSIVDEANNKINETTDTVLVPFWMSKAFHEINEVFEDDRN